MAQGVDRPGNAIPGTNNFRMWILFGLVEAKDGLCVGFFFSGCSWKCAFFSSYFFTFRVRLSAHLFGENLLDRTLFLEWYLSYLETCSLDMLPMAYLMLSIYWDELLKTRRLGRRLAEALLGKAEAVGSL